MSLICPARLAISLGSLISNCRWEHTLVLSLTAFEPKRCLPALVTDRAMEAWYHSPLHVLATLGGAAATWPLAARGQQPSKLPMIGVIGGGTPSTHGQLIAGRHRKHAPRHLATASYPCSPWFAQPPVSPRQSKRPLVQVPMPTFDQPCSSLSSCLCEILNTRAARGARVRWCKRTWYLRVPLCLPMAPALPLKKGLRHVPQAALR